MTERAVGRRTGRLHLRSLGVAACGLLLLAGCTGPDAEPKPDPTAFTLTTLPALDGSTTSIPLISQVMQQLGNVPRAQADNVETSTTPAAYVTLACNPPNPKGAVVLAYEPAQATKDAMAECSELEYHPIGRDALVFVVNESNPVDSLTTEQFQDIYSGKIANWKDVGGPDQKIVAYQRTETSGSQGFLEKLVMGGAKLSAAPAQTVMSEKGEVEQGLANYDNAANAIGYTVFYYASKMYATAGFKLLSVNGVAPTAETIADGSYPYIGDFNAVIRADDPTDSPSRRVVTWLESDAGKKAIAEAGYLAAK